jgi:hypothetical protein
MMIVSVQRRCSMSRVANENFADKTLSLSINVPAAVVDGYKLEQIRIAMRERSREATIARAFREFAEQCGVEFFPPSPALARLLRSETIPGPHTADIRGEMIVAWLPVSKTSSFVAVLLRRTRSESIVYVVEKSLRRAYQRYVLDRA